MLLKPDTVSLTVFYVELPFTSQSSHGIYKHPHKPFIWDPILRACPNMKSEPNNQLYMVIMMMKPVEITERNDDATRKGENESWQKLEVVYKKGM